MKRVLFLGLILLCLCAPSIAAQAEASKNALAGSLVEREIRYHNAEAGKVSFVWGINEWQMPDQTLWPEGTTVLGGERKLLETPMSRSGETFVASVRVPAGTKMNYLFHIVQARSGATLDAWDKGEYSRQPFNIVADQTGSTLVASALGLAEISYTAPEDTQLQVIAALVLSGLVLLLAVIALRVRKKNPYLDF